MMLDKAEPRHSNDVRANTASQCNSSHWRSLWLVFFVIIVCATGSTRSVSAQWTTTGNDISNSNTGNVGIGTGTTAPGYKLNVSNAEDKGQIRFGLGAMDSGGFLFSNAPSHAVFSGGASWNGGWFAKSMSSSAVQLNTGGVMFYGNTGLTLNSLFVPTERMRITPAGFVGIGSSNPTSKLHIVSGTDSSTSLLNLDTGVHGGTSMAVFGTANNESGFDMSVYRSGVYTSRFGVNSAGAVYLQPSGGNVGVGISTPDAFAKLHVYGSGGFGQDIQSTTNDWTRLRFVTPNRTWGFFLDASGGLLPQGSFGLYDYTASLFRMVFGTSGNIGIGLTTPGYKLDVAGSINSSGGLCIAGDCKSAWSQVGGSSQWSTSGSTINYSLGNVGIGVASPSTKLDVNGTVNATALTVNGTAVTSSQWATSGSTINYGSGNVGIGVASPSTKLDVNGTVNATALTVNGTAVTSSQWATSGSTINYGSGNVGIGVASPSTKLDVNGTVNATALTVNGTAVTSSQWATSGSTINYSTGNVGIATASPTEKLHVTGNVKVSGNIDVGGNINAKYQDLAEWVDSSQELSAGTVVVLNSTKSNQVIASTQSYDSSVAGVISPRPGIVLGEAGEGRVLVATTGRVKVRVDASNGPINIGDLLVTSNIEGVAMKSSPVDIGGVRLHRPGTILGKALEPLAKGQGEILVLLSLQ